MVPAAGEDGVVGDYDLASVTIEVARKGELLTVHVKVDDPTHPHVVASSQAFHLHRSRVTPWVFGNVVRQALSHAAVRLPKSLDTTNATAMDLVALAANMLRVPGENDAGNARTRPATEAAPAAGQRPERVVGECGDALPPQE
jgi:hypothetical protein